MKPVLLSADGDIMVYSVPDIAAENLLPYCKEFFKWLKESPNAAKYRSSDGCLCYREDAFIEYLNKEVFPDTLSVLIENLRTSDDSQIPEKYKNCPRVNF